MAELFEDAVLPAYVEEEEEDEVVAANKHHQQKVIPPWATAQERRKKSQNPRKKMTPPWATAPNPEEGEAVAKQERRQKIRQKAQKPQKKTTPPWAIVLTPEEMARKEMHRALAAALYEYDPKTDTSFYTRTLVHDLTTFDLDEETQYGPMRFTDSIIGKDHVLSDSLNVLFLKIMSSDAGYPINVYGTVIVRDNLDSKCINIFRRNRNNCQLVQSEDENLILTGPTRGVVFLGNAFFEINLKIKQDKECDDRQFSKVMLPVIMCEINSKVLSETLPSRLSEVQLVSCYIKNALEGTIEMKILSGPEVFYGQITACTIDVPDDILLYDSKVGVALAVGDDRVIQLLRRVVAVSVDEMLILNINSSVTDQCGNVSHRSINFTPFMKGADEDVITCGLYNMRVKVVWSTLFAP